MESQASTEIVEGVHLFGKPRIAIEKAEDYSGGSPTLGVGGRIQA